MHPRYFVMMGQRSSITSKSLVMHLGTVEENINLTPHSKCIHE